MEHQWISATTRPPENSILDILFAPSSAEQDSSGSMAEYYAPGCTRANSDASLLIERVRYRNRHYRPLTEGNSELHAILSVTITHWRLHTERKAVGAIHLSDVT